MNFVPMREVVSFAIGGGWGSETEVDGSVLTRVIRGADFPEAAEQNLSNAPLRWETESKVNTRSLLAGDIVLEVSGGTKGRPTGRTVLVTQKMVDESVFPLIPASFCRKVQITREVAASKFVYYWLQLMHKSGRAWRYQNQSTGIANFQFEQFLDSEFLWLPSLKTQQAIAAFLGSLDDKIAANTEAVRTIDRLRNALWHRNIEDGTTAAPLSSLASFVNGGAFTKNATGTGRVVVRIAEMSSGIGNNTVRNELNVSETKVVRPGELLFSWSGTLMTKRWPYDEAIVNQHIFKVIPDRGFPLVFLDCAIEQQLNFFRMIAAGKATTMGHIKRSDLDAKVQIPIQFREDDLRLAESLWVSASALEKENIALAKTRDELLPLLMSGKMTVREAGQEAAAAGAQIPSEENEV